MFGLDKYLQELSEDLGTEAMVVALESLIIQKIASVREGDFSSFARAFAENAVQDDDSDFDMTAFSEADGVLEQIEMTAADIELLNTYMHEVHFHGVPELVSRQIQSVSLGVAKRVNKDWHLRDAQENHDLAGFKFRQDQLWGKAFSKFRMLLSCCREVGAERLQSLQISTTTSDLDWAIQRLHARACLVASEVSTLVEGGFAHGAMARWRTLFEVEVVALTLNKGGETIAERFREHAAITARKEATAYTEHAPALKHRPLSATKEKRISQLYDQVVATYGKAFKEDYGWAVPLFSKSKLTLFDLAKLVDRHHMWPFYKMACSSVHGGSKALLFNIGLLEQQDILLAGASNAGHTDPIQLTGDSLVTLTGLLFHKEFASADVAATIAALRKIADEAKQEAFKSHRRQLRYHRAQQKAEKL